MDPVSITLIAIGWIARPLAKKLIDEVWKKYTKHIGLDKQTGSLKDELNKIQLLVEAAQSKQLPKEKVLLHDSLKDLKALIYKARDLLDELDYFRLQKEVENMNRAEQGTIFSMSPSHLPGYSKAGACKTLKLDKKAMSTNITTLVNELQVKYQYVLDILNLEQLGSITQAIQTVSNKVVIIDRPQTIGVSHETHIYGRDRERDQILGLIRDGSQRTEELPVVAIVGHAGLGKTTLAQLVYNDSEVETYFDFRMWICASTNFDAMMITRQMLEYSKVTSYNCLSNLTNLQNILKKSLEGKNVLLVLDDIWEIKYKSEWKSLITPLLSNQKSNIVLDDPSNRKSNMVLVTTRFPNIGNMVRSKTTNLLHLRGLDDSSFWSLFKKVTLGSDQYEVPYPLENIGREIAKRLSGNPLAIKTVGALLKINIDGLHWMEILKNETWKSQEGDEDIMPALKLSYEHLPVHLQQCFSYCSLFSKDYYFKAKELVYMWMAQGYINDDDKRKEVAGIEYLNILVERAFFQLTEHRGGPRYVIHDLMHDLAQVVSSEECLVICNPQQKPPPRPDLLHLYIFGLQGYNFNLHEFKNLSSLIIKGKHSSADIELNCDQTNNIRLLMLQRVEVGPYNFTSFIHLRCLEFYMAKNIMMMKDVQRDIVAQICILYHLEVLKFKGYYPRGDLPKYFNNLVNLRHFQPGHLHSRIAGVQKLKHLQELKEFKVREEKGFELEQLAGLKELKGSLSIMGLENVKSGKEADSARLSEKELVTLTLSWSWSEKSNCSHVLSEDILEGLQPNIKLRNLIIEYYGGCKSPSWLASHSIQFLESIRLSNCESWEVLPNFGELQSLRKLYLYTLPRVRAFTSQFHGCRSGRGFLSLKLMVVVDMAELETWVCNGQCEVFPILEKLVIENCPKLKECSFANLIPFHGQETMCFPHLFHLRIKNCPQLQQHLIPRIDNTSEAHLAKVVPFEKSEIRPNLHCYRAPPHLEVELVDLRMPTALDQLFVFKYFRNIKSMYVARCPNLTCFPWKEICLLHYLELLAISDCPKFLLSLDKEDDERKSFLPHNSLQCLTISNCGVIGDGLSYLLACLPAIRKLSIEDCGGVTDVLVPDRVNESNSDISQTAAVGSLMFLEKLGIVSCPNMFFANKGGLSCLTALKNVRIRNCRNILSSMTQEGQDDNTGYFPVNLETLSLTHVPDKMSWSPTDLTSLRNLEISDSPSLTFVDLYHFVALRDLELHNCEYLASVKGPSSIFCLESLTVSKCPRLVSSWSLASSEFDQEFLSTLKSLTFESREILSPPVCQFLKSLRSLKLKTVSRFHYAYEARQEIGCRYIFTEEQEEALLLLTALEELTFEGFDDMQSLPGELYRHPSLKKLTIDRCYNVDHLPDKGLPKSLKKVHLYWCSYELERECSKVSNLEISDEFTREFSRVDSEF